MQAEKIDIIKEYQKLDMQLYSLENEYKASNENKGVAHYKNKYMNIGKFCEKLIKDKNEQVENFEKTIKKFDELKIIEENINQDVNEIKDLVELDLYEGSLKTYEEYVTSIDKDIHRTIKKLNEIKIEGEKIVNAIEDVIIKYKKFKAARDIKKKEMLQKAAPLIKEMDKLKKSIDKDIMEKYQKLRANRTMPAFVQYIDGNCAGCGMQINLEVDKKLVKPGDVTECPECRRIVYKP